MSAAAAPVPVSPAWLALREGADAAARSGELADRLARALPATGPIAIHDLGSGSGAMGRWLAPRLRGPQRWVVHDRDPELLERCLADPPRDAAGAAVAIEARHADLAALSAEDVAGADAVVASALLDLLTEDELDAILDACVARGRPLLLALSVVGRVALTPRHPLDAPLAAAFDAHQRRDAAGGRLLGPDAPTVAAACLRAAGADVLVRGTPWRLGARDAGLASAWLDGWIAAACEQEPALAADAAGYRALRLAQAASGALAVTVDHADLLALP